MMKKRVLALLCAGMMLLSGCGGNGGGSEVVSDFDFNGYPMENAPKMTYWMGINANMSLAVDNAGKTEFAKELAKRTGVEVEYIHPVAGQEATALGLLIASGDMPDMIEYSWAGYNGGGQKNVDEGVIIALNDYIDKYAPNFKKYLEENPEIDKMIKTDDGTYYAFPFIRGDDRLLISTGPVYRRDWAEKANLDAPKTVADIEKILVAYKDQGVKKPLSVTSGGLRSFMQNFSTTEGFYLQDGKVVYGPLTDAYKNALTTYNKWYKEGLLDQNYISVDDATIKAQVLNGETGMAFTSGGGGLGAWLDTMEAKGEAFDMVGFTNTAVGEVGEEDAYYAVESNYPGYGSVAITTSCENPAAAVAFLDYGYSEEGNLLYNFGIEGVSYEVKDGECIFTDLINKNPDGLTQASAMTMYIRSSTAGAFVQDRGYIDQFYGRENQQQTLDAWLADVDTVKKNNLPKYTMTTEENEEYAEIMTEISTYVQEERDKFVTGQNSLDNLDKFIKNLKDLGIERAIEIVQAACDRYENK